MRPFLLLAALLVVFLRCAAPAPPPAVAPEPAAPAPAPVLEEEKIVGTVTVTASALNVRREPSTDAEVVTQVKKGTALDVLSADESWTKVRLAGGETGFVASRFVAVPGAKPAKGSGGSRKKGCPPDSDFAFLETPTPRFSDSGAHGVVVVEATVSASGTVTSTKLISNSTGDEALAFLTQSEIKSAKFSPPIRKCVPKAFIFTYTRTF
jgi:TonB family protein